MRLILSLLLAVAVCSVYAKDDHCKELVIWNPATKDTLMHFHRKASDLMTKDGACYYNTGWTAKVVTWHCQNMYLTKDGKSTFQKSHEASMTLKPYHVYCRSKWDKKGFPNPFMRDYGQKSDVTVLKSGNKLAFKCKCGCEFVVSQKFCETELTGEFSFSCPECKSKCLHE